ncbi:regulator of cell morphogenesis and NO signaling [Neisseria sp. HSC-16F19]|nr:hemerythrin domain-containing protein [Neisseria sp. HSC-16F19]MCP2040690.1 regulator of cell morphogenesis and NO signaling [Neisseria sp. HSC-16F19]
MSDLSLWQQAGDSSLIEHILARYHQVHRRQLQDILPLAEKVATVHADTFPQDILPLLQHMQQDLLEHMLKEERVLFPMILNGMGARAAMPINVMMHEHESHREAMAQLLALSHQLTPPPDACHSWQRLYAELQTLLDDLNDHIELENNILFARTLGH